MVIQIIQFETGLSHESLIEKAKERRTQFQEVPGLLQKYYFRSKSGEGVGGLYVWEDDAHMKAYAESELAKSIPDAYAVTAPPEIQLLDVLMTLRP